MTLFETLEEAEPHRATSTLNKLAFSVEESAEMLSISRSKTIELISQKRLGSIKVDNRRLITMHDLNEFIDECRRQANETVN